MLNLENELPKLFGSELQIDWGNNVRLKIIENIRDINYGKPLFYRVQEEKLEDRILKKIEFDLKNILNSEYWINVDKAFRDTETKEFFPKYYETIGKELLKQSKGESNIDVVPKEQKLAVADAYVCARYDKNRGNGVGAYAIVIVIAGEKEEFSKVFEGDIKVSTIKNIAVTEVFKICNKRKTGHLNLHYDYDGIVKLCTGQFRGLDEEARNMKMMYDRFNEFCSVDFIKVDEANSDEFYKRTTKVVYQTIYSVKC